MLREYELNNVFNVCLFFPTRALFLHAHVFSSLSCVLSYALIPTPSAHRSHIPSWLLKHLSMCCMMLQYRILRCPSCHNSLMFCFIALPLLTIIMQLGNESSRVCSHDISSRESAEAAYHPMSPCWCHDPAPKAPTLSSLSTCIENHAYLSPLL